VINPLPAVSAIGGGAPSVCSGSATLPFTNATEGGVWSIQAGTGTATIDQGGVVTGGNAGTVTVVYTLTNSCGSASATAPLTINPLPTVAAITGGATTVCMGSTTPAFVDATAGGLWTIQPGTGTASIDQNTGVVTPGTPGSVTVVYSVTNGCGTSSATKTLTINPLPTATIAYGNGQLCRTGTIAVTRTGQTGGTYAGNPSGLSINATSGLINLAASNAGSYTVTYTFSSLGCSNTATANITITALPTAGTIGDGAAFVCGGATTPVFTSTVPGGVWSITNGTGNASIDQSGAVTGNAAGTVTIRYTVTNSCGTATATRSFSVRANPVATIAYNGSPYCQTGNATVTRTGQGGGTYTSDAGLSINASSGAINLAASTTGSHTVVYTFSNSSCTSTTTATVVINSCSGINTRISNDVPVNNPKLQLQSTAMGIRVWPLPTESFFNLSIQSGSKETVMINIYDITGKKVQQLRGSPLETYRFGDTYVAGTYLIEVIQGTNRVTQKILKQ